MAVSHISDLKYKGFHPIDKRKTIKIINKQIDDFNQLNYDISEESQTIWAEFCKQLNEKVTDSSLFYHQHYLTKFIGYAASKAQKKISKADQTREKEFKNFVKSVTTNSDLTLEKILNMVKRFYGKDGKDGYTTSEINKLKDYYDQLMATTFLTMKGFLREQQKKKTEELKNKLKALIEDIGKRYPEGSPHQTNAKTIKNSLEQLHDILSGKSESLTPDVISCLKKCVEGNRNAASIIKDARPLEYAPFPKQNVIINKIIISFMGIITDGGTKLIDIVNKYIEK